MLASSNPLSPQPLQRSLREERTMIDRHKVALKCLDSQSKLSLNGRHQIPAGDQHGIW